MLMIVAPKLIAIVDTKSDDSVPLRFLGFLDLGSRLQCRVMIICKHGFVDVLSVYKT